MQVTIKGRIATTYLKAGEEATVERTSQIDDLARLGYIEVIDAEPEAAVEPAAAPVDEAAATPTADWTADELRAFCDREGLVYPPRARKALLWRIVEEWLEAAADLAPEEG